MTERIYYTDPTRTSFRARVVELRPAGRQTGVALDRTAFYPTSGGQPCDTGTLGESPVVDVVDEQGTIIHLVTGAPPEAGSEVTGTIDSARRRDHTQQHSGQHVLSAAFEQTVGLKTVSFHLGTESATIDLNAARLEDDVVARAEELANRVVLEDRPVRIHFAASDDLERFALRKPTERTGQVRVVEIADFDHSACGGTHVTRTGQIGPIKVRRWERRGAETRVEFLAGERALRDYARRLSATRALAERLSVKDTDVLTAALHALDDLDRLRDENADLRERMLDREAEDLLAAATPLAAQPAIRVVYQIFVGRSPDDLKRLALRLVARSGVVALLGSRGERASVVLAQSPGLPADLGILFRQVGPPHGVRGGGTRDLVQGGGAADVSLVPFFEAVVKAL